VKDKFQRKWRLLCADLSSPKRLFCFVCSVFAASVGIVAMLAGFALFLAGYSLTLLSAHDLAQLQSMTVAQLLPVVKPAALEYMLWFIVIAPIVALLSEIARSIENQERSRAAE
jgi:hypothetical protein